MNIPGAGEGQGPSVSQVDQTTGQVRYGGLCRGTGSQSLQFESRVHTAGSCRETSHLSLQLPTYCHHITPPGGTDVGRKDNIINCEDVELVRKGIQRCQFN